LRRNGYHHKPKIEGALGWRSYFAQVVLETKYDTLITNERTKYRTKATKGTQTAIFDRETEKSMIVASKIVNMRPNISIGRI